MVSSGGSGYQYGTGRKGKFSVHHYQGNKDFDNLDDAIIHYESIQDESTLWDNSGKPPVLLAIKEFVNIKSGNFIRLKK